MDNVSGIQYSLPLPFYVKNDRLFFKEWLLYIFDDDNVKFENNAYLSIDIPAYDINKKFGSFFHADIWYDDIKEYTPVSQLIPISKYELNEMLVFHRVPPEFQKRVYLKGDLYFRLNSLSSKYNGIKSFADAIYHICVTDRTRNTLKKNNQHYLFVRKYIDFAVCTEYRCFITNRSLLGVTFNDLNPLKNNVVVSVDIKLKIIKFISKIMKEICYDDCTIDIAINDNNLTLFVVEINSPVYFLAGSGNFTLDEVKEFLLEKKEEYTYPIFM